MDAVTTETQKTIEVLCCSQCSFELSANAHFQSLNVSGLTALETLNGGGILSEWKPISLIIKPGDLCPFCNGIMQTTKREEVFSPETTSE